MQQDDARRTLSLVTLRVLSIPRTHFDAPAGLVASQTPAAGALVPADSNVLIAITTGTP
jgi:beta-lactam-binding protein with PASTA domain